MPSPARVVVLENYGVLTIQELDLPTPLAHQVLVEIYGAGIQPTQLHLVQDSPSDLAIIPGSEATGRVLAVGDAVARVQVGDVVLISPYSSVSDRSPELVEIEFEDGSIHVVGPVFTWGTNTVVDEQFLSTLPNLVDKEGAAILGQTAFYANAAVKDADVAGKSVVVVGCSGSGLSTVALCKAAGAEAVYAVDSSDARLEIAKQLGATEIFNNELESVAAAIHELNNGGVDRVFDSLYELDGIPRLATQVLNDSGSAYLLGVAGTEDFEHERLEIEESDYRSFPIPDLDSGLENMLEAINSNYLQTSLMTSMRFTIEETNEAITILENGEMVGHGVLVIEPLQ